MQMSWADFIRSDIAVLAGVDFFTVEVLTWRGLATYYVLFFLHLERHHVTLAGITQDPTEEWMVQIARRAVDNIDSALLPQHASLPKFRAPSSHSIHRVLSSRTPSIKATVISRSSLLLSRWPPSLSAGRIRCHERLSGLLKCYQCAA
jgi:hypothetical protein